MDDLRDFETQLRAFRPAPPGPLRAARSRRWPVLPGLLAAAAALLVGVLGMLGLEGRRTPADRPGGGAVDAPAPRPARGAMTRGQMHVLMLSGESALGRGLDEEEKRLLKPVGGEGRGIHSHQSIQPGGTR